MKKIDRTQMDPLKWLIKLPWSVGKGGNRKGGGEREKMNEWVQRAQHWMSYRHARPLWEPHEHFILGFLNREYPPRVWTTTQGSLCLGQITEALSGFDLQLRPKVPTLSIVPFKTQCGAWLRCWPTYGGNHIEIHKSTTSTHRAP